MGIRFTSLFFAGLAALALNSAAYVAEIFRSGIESIDKGQMEAGRASGLTYAQTMRHLSSPGLSGGHTAAYKRVRDARKRHLARQRDRSLRASPGGVSPPVRNL